MKQVIIVMEENYPFGKYSDPINEKMRVLVRKKYQVLDQERKQLAQKANMLKRMKNQQLIRLQSILEEQQGLQLLFQYIPIKLENWIANINDKFIENFRDQLIKFSSQIASNSIITDFNLNNAGMDEKYQAKYFLGLDFEIDPTTNTDKLKAAYARQIFKIFKPYMNKKKIEKTPSEEETTNYASFQKQSIHYNESKHIKNVEKCKQLKQVSKKIPKLQKNQKCMENWNESEDSENEKILEEFMDVLGNQNTGDKPRKQDQKEDIPQLNRLSFKEQIKQEIVWNEEEDDLQKRIKKAILNSQDAIKKFKNFKNSGMRS